MRVFQHASCYSDRLDVGCFVLDMCIHGNVFMTQDGGTQSLTAAGARGRHWLQYGGKGAAWCRAHSAKTCSSLARTEEGAIYSFLLSAMDYKFLCLHRDGDLCQNSFRPSVHFCCIDFHSFTTLFLTSSSF